MFFKNWRKHNTLTITAEIFAELFPPLAWPTVQSSDKLFSLFTFTTEQLRSFSIQLSFTLGQKIPPEFRTEYVQSWHLKNRAEKDERTKKLRIFNYLGRFLRKKLSTNQILVKRKQRFWKMATDNVKAAFCLTSGVNEDFIRNLE